MKDYATREVEKYIYSVCDQIEYEKIHGYISDELCAHIEDQKQEYIDNGLAIDAAERKAVADMGDPIEVGKELNRIHRIRHPWGLTVIMIQAVLVTLITQVVGACVNVSSDSVELFRTMTGNTVQLVNHSDMAAEFIKYVVMGLICLTAFALNSYKQYIRQKNVFCFVVSVCVLRIACLWLASSNSSRLIAFFNKGSEMMVKVSVPVSLFVFVQILTGSMEKQSKTDVRPFCWMLVSVLCAFLIPSSSLAIAVVFADTVMLVTFRYLTCRDKKGFASATVRFCIYSVFLIGLIVLLCVYLQGNEKAVENEWAKQFTSGQVQYAEYLDRFGLIMKNCRFIGGSDVALINSATALSENMFMDYVLYLVAAHFGIASMILMLAIIAAVPILMIRYALKQSAVQGKILGVGIGAMLLARVFLCLLTTFGIVPLTPVSMPFLSYGLVNICCSYTAIGLGMSIYRYKDIPVAE